MPESFAFPISITAFKREWTRQTKCWRARKRCWSLKVKTIAALIVEPVVGTNGVLIPPDGYMQGLRKLCDKHGILLIADEVMAGFGRTGEWFSVDHWKIVPDLISMAKGLTSAYVQLGAVGMRRQIADHFQNNFFNGGLTYNSHPIACAAGIATISVYEEDKLIENARRMGTVMRGLMEELESKHPSVGATRNIGLFGIVELVRNRRHASRSRRSTARRRRCRRSASFSVRRALHPCALEHVLHQSAAVHYRNGVA